MQGLKAMDSGGTSDPYVKLHLLPGASKVQSMHMHLLQTELNLHKGAPPVGIHLSQETLSDGPTHVHV